MVSLALISPRPSSRTPSLARRITRDFTSDSALMVSLASSSLASIACWMRSRLISANSSRKMLLKPRFGSRRWIGIWPPSKPLMRTRERAVWPLPPRPGVLPLPEPMPRPTRMRFLREPVLSAISLSFIVRFLLSFRRPEVRGQSPSLEGPRFVILRGPLSRPPQDDVNLFPVDDADEMLNLRDHAANFRGVLQLGNPADLVHLHPDQRRTLPHV